ncbi:MAG: trigger factor [Thermoguttaceae bacterium]|jgi:trigger factor
MSDNEQQETGEALDSQEVLADQGAETPEVEEKPKLQLGVDIQNRSACQRHIGVTISREDIDRYFDHEFSELRSTAQVPGFRPGHAPRKLVEHRFRKEVAEKVKGALLMDSLAQIHDEHDLSAISEPDLDLESVEIPKEGPLTFEFDLEVRPQFDLPKWKGLSIERPVREFTAEDVEGALQRILAERGRLVPYDRPAQPGDYITTNLTFKHGEQVISSASEEVIRLRPVLSFRDGKIEGFDAAMAGVTAGQARTLEARLSEDAPNEALRGQTVTAVFDVLEVKKLEIPELDAHLLHELGGFELEADLRDEIRDALKRRLEYQQRQRARQQITAALTVAADWELPPELLKRQSQRELQRAVLELRSSGFSDDEIRARENLLRQNSRASTARALKEHFILERIAEVEEIEAGEEDYDREIERIADQSGESARRVRARLEKGGAMDALHNQVVEHKVVDRILEHAQFREVPYVPEETDVTALELAAGGGEHSDIPEAKPGGEPAQARPESPRMRSGGERE